MGCNCGSKKAGAPQFDYIYVSTKGVQTTYGNEFEARARVLRDGGSWRKVPKGAAA